MEIYEARSIAQRIAAGHAFEKHIVERREFPEFTTRAEFAAAIERVLLDPSARKPLLRQRVAYWSDAERMLVIVDMTSIDLGTAYRPIVGHSEIQLLG